MKYVLIAFLFLAAISTSAQTPARIILDRESAGVFPAGWAIVPVPESTFLMLKARNQNIITESAYTDFAAKVTFVREHFILTAPPAVLRHTLLHEAGHIQCKCSSEHEAEMWANKH